MGKTKIESATEAEALILEALDLFQTESDENDENGKEGFYTRSYEELMILARDSGFVLTTDSGAEFQISILRVN